MGTNVSPMKPFLFRSSSILPLIIFRIIFGLLMFISVARFWWMGWIQEFYLEPDFHFTYYGFRFITIPSAFATYALFTALLISCVFISIGFLYRLSILFFFLTFTYIELWEKVLYLNHYYFVSLLSFLLIFLPLHHNFSVDSRWLFPEIKRSEVPFLFIFIIQLQIAIVYFFAGVAKLNADWLFDAQPLSIWLNSKTDIWLLGRLFEWKFSFYLMSWGGAVFDLSVPFLLWNKRTRLLAYLFVCIFHLMTAFLFNIGMFPYIMMSCTILF